MSRAAVRVLAVDDAPANLTALRGRLELAFAQLDLEVVWEEAESPAAGVNQLQHFDADLLVADVMYANADDVGGLEPGLLPLMLAVDALARRPFVAAMSTHNEARSGEPERTAISLGVDLFMDRRKSIAPEAIADLARTVHDQLLANGRIHHTDVRSAPSNDPRAQAIVEEIGAAIIAELFFRALGDDALRPQQLHLAYLKPGLSGSVVCRVDAQDEAGHSVHVMKLSRDASLLAKELTRGRVLGQQVQRCFVPHTSTSVTRPLAGWNAILLPLADRAVTLREWLSHGPAADAVDSVLEVLFVEGLGPMYQRRVQPAVATIGQVLSLGGYRANLVASAMADLAPALVKMLGADMTKNLTTGLAAFVRRGIVLDIVAEALPEANWSTLVHGDMHMSNVLIFSGSKIPAPAIIDSSDVAVGHWAADAARMYVDIILGNICDSADAMFWDDWSSWHAQTRDLASGSDSSPRLHAAAWLIANADSFVIAEARADGAESVEWQWHAQVAREFCRATSRLSVPPSVRALAAACAWDHLALSRVAMQGHSSGA